MNKIISFFSADALLLNILDVVEFDGRTERNNAYPSIFFAPGMAIQLKLWKNIIEALPVTTDMEKIKLKKIRTFHIPTLQ